MIAAATCFVRETGGRTEGNDEAFRARVGVAAIQKERVGGSYSNTCFSSAGKKPGFLTSFFGTVWSLLHQHLKVHFTCFQQKTNALPLLFETYKLVALVSPSKQTPSTMDVSHERGTINIFLICKDEIVIGVDSRVNFEPYPDCFDILDDSVGKYKELVSGSATTPTVGITGAGSRKRMIAIWNYAEMLVDSGVKCIVQIAESVLGFMNIPRVAQEDRGFSWPDFICPQQRHTDTDEDNTVPLVFTFTDTNGVPSMTRTTEGVYHAIGTGAGPALASMRASFANWNQNQESITKIVARTLLMAATEDQCFTSVPES